MQCIQAFSYFKIITLNTKNSACRHKDFSLLVMLKLVQHSGFEICQIQWIRGYIDKMNKWWYLHYNYSYRNDNSGWSMLHFQCKQSDKFQLVACLKANRERIEKKNPSIVKAKLGQNPNMKGKGRKSGKALSLLNELNMLIWRKMGRKFIWKKDPIPLRQ